MQDAFSLLAYADPWSSPVGYQLDPVEREPVCAALNSAILGDYGQHDLLLVECCWKNYLIFLLRIDVHI